MPPPPYRYVITIDKVTISDCSTPTFAICISRLPPRRLIIASPRVWRFLRVRMASIHGFKPPSEIIYVLTTSRWYSKRDLNPHVLRQWCLRPPRLPFRHSSIVCIRVPASRLTHDAFEKKWFERIGVEPIIGVAVSTLSQHKNIKQIATQE